MRVRCLKCRKEFDETEIEGAKECPNCHDRGVPMDVANDVMVKINWHELRMLCLWAERWAQHCTDNHRI